MLRFFFFICKFNTHVLRTLKKVCYDFITKNSIGTNIFRGKTYTLQSFAVIVLNLISSIQSTWAVQETRPITSLINQTIVR